MIIARTLAVAATAAGLIAWIVFLRAGLVLSHYDAKAHLVVARRVIDSITPGWQQFGAVWLPTRGAETIDWPLPLTYPGGPRDTMSASGFANDS